MRDLVAVSPGPGRIDLFWRDDADALWTRTWRAAEGWGPDTDLGGTLVSPPAIVAWAPDQLEVFAIFADGELWDRYWDGRSWHAWESLGGRLTGTPAASTWGADRLDVFASGIDGAVWHRWWDGTRWVAWEQLPA